MHVFWRMYDGHFSWYVPRFGTTGSGHACVLTSADPANACSKNGWSILHSCYQNWRVLFVPHPHQHVALAVVLLLAMVGVHPMEVFICIFFFFSRNEAKRIFRPRGYPFLSLWGPWPEYARVKAMTQQYYFVQGPSALCAWEQWLSSSPVRTAQAHPT